jgi:Uncharacterised protein family (UPF0236)
MLEVEERVWRTGAGAYLRPFSTSYGLRHRGWSRRLQRLASDFGLEEAFAAGTQRLYEHHGVTVATSGLRRCSLRHAHAIGAREKHAHAVRTLPARGAAGLIIEADGTMLPMVRFRGEDGDRRKCRGVEWAEGRLLAAQVHGRVQTCYAASFGDVAEAGCQWTWAAARAGWATATHVHAVSDGAEWIERQHRTHFARHGTYLVDFFHVCEYLAAAAPAAQPDWLDTQKQRLRTNQLAAVLAALAARQEPLACPEENAPVRAAHRYLSNRSDQLDYAAALAADLPIGSGMIESGHRHLFHRRLKIPGAAWLRPNAEAIAHTRCARPNHLWAPYWASLN